MKIEKINDDKIKIFLSYDELEERDLSISEFSKNAKNAQDFFISIFEETNLDLDFLDEDSQLLIEANINKDNLFVLTVTKIYHLPDLDEYNENNSCINKNNSNKLYSTKSNLYEFDTLEHIIEFSKKAKIENLFCGYNKLYKYKDKYFLLFKPSSIKNKKFFRTHILLSEYCIKAYIYKELINSLIEEKCKLIINSSAIQKLSDL